MTYLLAIEGPDGSGKTTLTRLLASELRAAGLTCEVKAEFPQGKIGDFVRKQLVDDPFLDFTLSASPLTSLFFFGYLQALALDATPPAQVVLADRYTPTLAIYQTRHRPSETVAEEMTKLLYLLDSLFLCMGRDEFNHALILDVPIEILAKRLAARESRILPESELGALEHVRSMYLFLARKNPTRFIVVDGTKAAEEIAGDALQFIKRALSKSETI